MRETRDLWDAWSDDFQGYWNAETEADELPPAPIKWAPHVEEGDQLDPLPPIEGRDVVVLGCGGGQGSIGFAHEGAGRVVGVDFSTEQLGHARDHRDAHGVDVGFAAGDVTALPLSADAFDIAFSSAVLQMVGDLDACFAEAHRVLHEGGTLFVSLPHPFYEQFDPETRELERSYFDDSPERKQIGDLDPEMVVYHHTVGDLHRALVESGFTVERVLEPGVDDPAVYREQFSQKPDLMAEVPRNVAFRAVAD